MPSWATIRLRPPRRGNASGCARPGCCLPAGLGALSRRSPFVMLPEFSYEARESLGPDPHLEGVLLQGHPLHKELDDPRLSAGNSSAQTVAKSASRTVTSRSVISSSPRASPPPRSAPPAPAQPTASGRGRAPRPRHLRRARWSPVRLVAVRDRLPGHVIAIDPSAPAGVARRHGPAVRAVDQAFQERRNLCPCRGAQPCAGSAITACALSQALYSGIAACWPG